MSERAMGVPHTATATGARFGALVGAALLLLAAPAFAQSGGLPTLQEYPLQNRIFGPGGAITPDYVMPPETRIAYMVGTDGGPKGTVFGAASVDFMCQQEERPQIKILSAPAHAKVTVSPGTFRASGTDAGSTFCLGRPVNGAVVRYIGSPPRAGGTVTVRVTYPHLGAWYDHVVALPAR